MADRFSEGAGLLELAVAAASRGDGSLSSRIELLVALSYATPEEDGAQRAAPRMEGTIAFGVTASGDDEHAATLAEDARVRLEEVEQRWTAGMRTQLGGGSPAGSNGAATADGLRKAEAIADEAFQVAGLLLETWIAECRDEFAQAVAGYRRTLRLACGARTEHEASLLAAKTARALWSSAHARAELTRARRALGHTETARALHRRLVGWSREPRLQQPREVVLAAPAGSPAAAGLSTAVDTRS